MGGSIGVPQQRASPHVHHNCHSLHPTGPHFLSCSAVPHNSFYFPPFLVTNVVLQHYSEKVATFWGFRGSYTTFLGTEGKKRPLKWWRQTHFLDSLFLTPPSHSPWTNLIGFGSQIWYEGKFFFLNSHHAPRADVWKNVCMWSFTWLWLDSVCAVFTDRCLHFCNLLKCMN